MRTVLTVVTIDMLVFSTCTISVQFVEIPFHCWKHTIYLSLYDRVVNR